LKRYFLTPLAGEDIRKISEYTKDTWGADQARAYVDHLKATLSALAETPYMARKRPEIGDGFLSFPFRSHLIFFKQDKAGIQILRVMHGAQNYETQYFG